MIRFYSQRLGMLQGLSLNGGMFYSFRDSESVH